jgi:AraC family transcriptional regulator
MNTLERMNDAMRYIEDNLAGEISFSAMARIAGCSEYHFRRMFSFLAGMPLGEYIRRRRLAKAAVELQKGDKRVLDVALAFGYDSPDAFAKAFGEMHGCTPSQVRKNDAFVKAFLPVTFRLTVKGADEMKYRMVEKDAFCLVGFKQRITLVFEGVNPQMDSLVQRMTPEIIAQLKDLSDTEPLGIVSASASFAQRTAEGSELDQYIGVATTKAAPAGYDLLPVEASLWAVFSVVGAFPQALQDAWARIYSEWFLSSGYEATAGPEILKNDSPDTSKPDYKSEIWIPVRRAGGRGD